MSLIVESIQLMDNETKGSVREVTVNCVPLLHWLHWLRAPQRIPFKLAVLAFRCLRGLAPTYLSDSMRHVADLPGRQRLRSASSEDLAVPQTRLQTVGDRAFCVAAAKTWNVRSDVISDTVDI